MLLTVRWLRVSRHDGTPDVDAENLAVLPAEAHSPRPVNVRGPVSPGCCPWQCVLPWRKGSGCGRRRSAPGVAHGQLLSGCFGRDGAIGRGGSAPGVGHGHTSFRAVQQAGSGSGTGVSPRCCPRSAPFGMFRSRGGIRSRWFQVPGVTHRTHPSSGMDNGGGAGSAPGVAHGGSSSRPVNGWLSVPVCS
jgi:hypothetical protein